MRRVLICKRLQGDQMQLLRLELGQGSRKESWSLGGVRGRSANVAGNNEGYKETWTR